MLAPVNDPPVISDIANQSTTSGTPTGLIPFLVGDIETPAAALGVSADSSNGTLVPPGNITFGGSGSHRTERVTPAAGQAGTAVITVTVTDGVASASDTFVLTVVTGNQPPTLDPIASLALNENALPTTVNLTGIGPGTPGENQPVTVTAVSDN